MCLHMFLCVFAHVCLDRLVVLNAFFHVSGCLYACAPMCVFLPVGVHMCV